MRTIPMILGKYRNGNYDVVIFEDGTKVRSNKLDYFTPEFPETFDFCITKYCDMNCSFCYEGSTTEGIHGDIMNLKFIDTLHPYTEIAIGGGNPLSHPDLIPFLKKCKELKLIPSMTVNQTHFLKNKELIHKLVDEKLINGIGVSLNTITDEFIEEVSKLPNVVIHVISGIVMIEQLEKLKDKGLKILILGYKTLRRGKDLYELIHDKIQERINTLIQYLPKIIEEDWFDVLSFDNLGIEQLKIKELVPEKDWNMFYLGQDGFASMYVDGVNQEFSVSSLSLDRYKLEDDIKTMFEVIRKK